MTEKPLTFRNAWRPFMAWIFGYVSILLWAAWALVIFFFAENTGDVVSITTAFSIPLGADLAALASIVTFYVHGRTKEKLEDKQNDILTEPNWQEAGNGRSSRDIAFHDQGALHPEGD